MKKTNWKHILTASAASLLSLALLAGCGVSSNSSSVPNPSNLENQAAGTPAVGAMLLSVNPEIEIEYDDKGLVLEIEGINDDGKNVITGYTGFEGRKCDDVVNDLVQKIYEGGYFEKTVGGKVKNIVIKLEEGSVYPSDAFLEEVVQEVEKAVKQFGISSVPMPIDQDDIGENGYIGLDKAKELVLSQLGLNEATFTDREYELDDGVYELEFTANGVEYEFEVNAVSGKVLEADYEHNDDWKDDLDDHDDLDDDDKDDDTDDLDDDDKDDDTDDLDDDDKDDDTDDLDDDDKDDDTDDLDDDDKDDDTDDLDDDDKDDDTDGPDDDDKDDDTDDPDDDDKDDDTD